MAYECWLRRQGRKLVTATHGRLQCDRFETAHCNLIEAKSSTSREHTALGHQRIRRLRNLRLRVQNSPEIAARDPLKRESKMVPSMDPTIRQLRRNEVLAVNTAEERAQLGKRLTLPLPVITVCSLLTKSFHP